MAYQLYIKYADTMAWSSANVQGNVLVAKDELDEQQESEMLINDLPN